MRPPPRLGSLRPILEQASPAALVLSAALPFVVLHRNYQPSSGVGSVNVNLGDIGIAATVVAASVVGVRDRFGVLRRTAVVWIPYVLFLAWILASLAWARSHDPSYTLGSHLVSALKYVAYASLAPGVAVILRTPADRRLFFFVVVGWSCFLSLIAVLQFVGLVDELHGRRPVQREFSYAGVHELGAYSGITLALALVSIALALRGRRAVAAGVAGGLGAAIAAALDSVGGIAVAAIVVVLGARLRRRVSLRRVLAIAAIVAAVAGTAISLRGTAVTAFFEFLGIQRSTAPTKEYVQSYAHRTLLGYLGLKIWLDHPLIGAGWQESNEPAAFEPNLPDVHRRFPNEPALAFPSPKHKWGVQNGIIQTLADLGLVGLGLLAAAVCAAFAVAFRVIRNADDDRAFAAISATAWLWITFAAFTGTGLLPGSSISALLWVAVGLAASVRNYASDR